MTGDSADVLVSDYKTMPVPLTLGWKLAIQAFLLED